MNKKVELLKNVARSGKNHKLPKKFIVFELVIVLSFYYVFSFVFVLLKNIFNFIIPDKKIITNYLLFIGLVFLVITSVMGYSNDDENVYGEGINNEESCSFKHNASQGEFNSESNGTGENNNYENNNENSDENKNTVTDESIDYDKLYGDTASIGELSNIYDDKLTEGAQEIYNVASGGEIEYYQNILQEGNEEIVKDISYYIKVNRQMNCITIYVQGESGEYDVPIKAMRCSTGGENTPLGIYKTSQKYEFRKLLFNVYGQYATRIVDQILFHSSSYDQPSNDKLIASEFNKLGEAVSHGCIRLTVEDAKWIYEKCKLGTIVEIYDDSNPGPLGKPEVINIPEDSVWDPTDIVDDNPWNNAKPSILTGDTVRYVIQGQKPDLLGNITALDSCGNDITDKIVISGNVNENVVGKYIVRYYIKDLLNRSYSTTVEYIVK